MNRITNLSKMICVVAILMVSNLWANANRDVQDSMDDDFIYLMLDHYESDFVLDEEQNYYRNFLMVGNLNNALTYEQVAYGENTFILFRYDADVPDVLISVAVLRLTIDDSNRVNYVIEYDNETQTYLPTDNLDIVTQGILAVNDGIIDMDGVMFVDRFAANVAMNTHPNMYGYVLKAMDNEKSSNFVVVPVMKNGATIDGFFTQQEVINDVDATLLAGVKNANVEMMLESYPNIYYYDLERGDNSAPNQLISRLQRRSDGTYMEVYDFLPQYFYEVYEPGVINRLDDNVILGEFGDYMSYMSTIWTFGFDRVDYDSNHINNSYGSPVCHTGVARINLTVDGSADTGVRWFDEDGNSCIIFNPIICIDAEMPNYASVEYEPYMYRVWRLCDGIRNYQLNSSGFPVNDIDALREPFKLIAEVYDDSTSIMVGSEEGEELAFGATADSCNDGILFLVRLYYKKVGDQDGPMYYVVENKLDWTVFYNPTNYGDANGDGSVDILDVTTLIDWILGYNTNINFSMADMNGDHAIDLSDVILLIDWILLSNK